MILSFLGRLVHSNSQSTACRSTHRSLTIHKSASESARRERKWRDGGRGAGDNAMLWLLAGDKANLDGCTRVEVKAASQVHLSAAQPQTHSRTMFGSEWSRYFASLLTKPSWTIVSPSGLNFCDISVFISYDNNVPGSDNKSRREVDLQCTSICSIMAKAWEIKIKDKLLTQQVWSCLLELRLSAAV